MFKQREPCGYYWGNVCTGFGGTSECIKCGWPEGDHTEFDKLFGAEGEELQK